MIASLWPQQARQDLVGRAFEVACDISQDRPESSQRKHLVVRHSDVMYAAHPSHPNVAAGLAVLLITEDRESFLEIGA